MKKSSILQTLGIIVFFLGVALGLALAAGLNLASLEGFIYFGTAKVADEKMKTLHCPAILSSNETGYATATITNTTESEIQPIYKLRISDEIGLWREVEEYPTIATGETRQLRWEIGPGDVAFGYLILFKVRQTSAYLTPSREDACGTLVVDIPVLTGRQILWSGSLGSLLLMVAGTLLCSRGKKGGFSRHMSLRTAMIVQMLVLLGAIACGLFDLWLPGGLLLVLSVLLVVVTLSFLSNSPGVSG